MGFKGLSKSFIESLKSKLDYAIFPILDPYPGTEIFNDALKTGYFINENGERVASDKKGHKIWVPDKRERKELEQLGILFMSKFYLRPRILLSMMIGMTANLPIKRLFRLFYAGLSYFVIARFQSTKYGSRY